MGRCLSLLHSDYDLELYLAEAWGVRFFRMEFAGLAQVSLFSKVWRCFYDLKFTRLIASIPPRP